MDCVRAFQAFDLIVEKVSSLNLKDTAKLDIITTVIETLEDNSWGTQRDSAYFDRNLVKAL